MGYRQTSVQLLTAKPGIISGSYSRDPNMGIKLFMFRFMPFDFTGKLDRTGSHTGKGVEPYRYVSCQKETGSDGNVQEVCNGVSRDELLNNSEFGCNKSAKSHAYCTALIQENGWKIPDDYPFKF